MPACGACQQTSTSRAKGAPRRISHRSNAARSRKHAVRKRSRPSRLAVDTQNANTAKSEGLHRASIVAASRIHRPRGSSLARHQQGQVQDPRRSPERGRHASGGIILVRRGEDDITWHLRNLNCGLCDVTHGVLEAPVVEERARPQARRITRSQLWWQVQARRRSAPRGAEAGASMLPV